MGFHATMIFYLLIGMGVATAVFLSDARPNRLSPGFRTATSVVFWPLYLPILLAGPRPGPRPETRSDPGDDDAMSQAIARVEAELETALASLDGWVEDVLAHESGRFHELSTAWYAQAERIREMDRLLARAEPAASGPEVGVRYRQSEQARRDNLVRLREVRDRAYEDLMGTLTRVRELVSMIHLAKFTGAPASRAEELVGQIAAAIEGISAVTWQEPQPESNVDVPPIRQPYTTTRAPEEILPCDYSGASATSSPRI
ncbi:MAG: hypothetical protein ACLQGP_07535 [Isosphaeraceae bacterium]